MTNGFAVPQMVTNVQSVPGIELITFRVVAAQVPLTPSATRTAPANKAALPEGWNHAIVSKSSSVFTFTLARVSRRPVCIIGAVCLTADRIINTVTVANNQFTIRTTNLAGVANDADFHVTIARFSNPRVF